MSWKEIGGLKPWPIIINITTGETVIEDNGTRVTIKIPGFTIRDICKPGSTGLSVFDVIRLLRTAYFVLSTEPNTIYGHLRKANTSVFIKNYQIDVNTDIYARRFNYDSSGFVKVPLTFDWRLTYMGKTSIIFRVIMSDSSGVLASCDTLLVTMGLDARKPVEVPESIRNHFDIGQVNRPQLTTNLSIPKHSADHISFYQAGPDAIDINQHLNFHIYLSLTLNGVTSICQNDVTDLGSEQLFVEKIFMSFKNDALLGDMIKIETWRSENKFCIRV